MELKQVLNQIQHDVEKQTRHDVEWQLRHDMEPTAILNLFQDHYGIKERC